MRPKILIISRAFRAGDGITISNLFSKFDKDSLYGLFQLYDSTLINIFNNYHIIRDEYKIKHIMGFPIAGAYNRDNNNSENGKIHLNFYQSIKKKLCLYVRRNGLRLLKFLDLYETRYRINCTSELEQWIKDVNPDIIYTSLGDLPMAIFIDEIHYKFPDIKIALHCFDDWPNPSYRVYNSSRHLKRCEEVLMNILSYATFRYTSSERMAYDYELKYGYKFTCFPNPIEVDKFHIKDAHIKDANDSQNNKEILFLGKIGRHNANAIRDMMNAVELYNKKTYSKLIFKIYTGVDFKQIELLIGTVQKHTVINTSIPNNEIPKIIHKSTILFLPISINKTVERFTRYSMSTKMGEYLASERPVLFCGPSDIAMSEFLNQHKCTIIVNKSGTLPLYEALEKCLSNNTEIRIQLARGLEVAHKYFDKESVASRFMNDLSQNK